MPSNLCFINLLSFSSRRIFLVFSSETLEPFTRNLPAPRPGRLLRIWSLEEVYESGARFLALHEGLFVTVGRKWDSPSESIKKTVWFLLPKPHTLSAVKNILYIE